MTTAPGGCRPLPSPSAPAWWSGEKAPELLRKLSATASWEQAVASCVSGSGERVLLLQVGGEPMCLVAVGKKTLPSETVLRASPEGTSGRGRR